MSKRAFPAVEVTIDSGYTNVPPTVWVSYLRTTTVQGNPVVLDQWGMDYRTSPACVRPLGYDITVSIVGGKLVATPVV